MYEVARRFNELLFTGWDYFLNYPVNADLVLGLIAAGIIVSLYLGQQRKRRRLHRMLWMSIMRRRDKEKYHRMRFEDGIGDAALDMLIRGEITEEQLKRYYAEFASLGYTGLIPKKNPHALKKAIRNRLWNLYARFNPKVINPKIPGGHPAEDVKPDPTYVPVQPATTALEKSRYANVA